MFAAYHSATEISSTPVNHVAAATKSPTPRRSLLALAVVLTLAAQAASAAPEPQTPNIHLDNLRVHGAFDGVIVKYRSATRAAMAGVDGAKAQAARLDGLEKATGVDLQVRDSLGTGALLIESTNKALGEEQILDLLEALAADPEVEYAQPNGRKYALMVPNDPGYSSQWHYHATGAGLKLPLAWDIATGTGVTVAVLDTGITSHADLNANVVAGYDFISSTTRARDGNGRDGNAQDEGDWFAVGDCPAPNDTDSSDSSWHGTHVAGTIAAVSNNSSGVAGVAFGARVQPVRVLGRCGGSDADIVQAITWASGGTVTGVPANATPARVINMSLGGEGSCDPASQDAINQAVARGTVVVVAAGNEDADASGYSPASCNNVINVAALNPAGDRAAYSNFGSSIDVAAPGGFGRGALRAEDQILSTINNGTTVPGTAAYAWNAGTSMAAPHIAGLAALVLSKAPSMTPAAVETLIRNNTRAIPGSCPEGCGSGLADAEKTLKAIGNNELRNGVPITGISAAINQELRYTMVVPSGARNLNIGINGSNGDADLYVRFGSAPTTSVTDCRSDSPTSVESCPFPTPNAGTYHVLVRAYKAFSGLTLSGRYETGTRFENTSDFAIRDMATVESPIAISRSGNAPTGLKVGVDINHSYIGDLRIDLVAPDGSLYNLHNRSGGATSGIHTTYTVNASSELASGTWRLRVADMAADDTGVLDRWSLEF